MGKVIDLRRTVYEQCSSDPEVIEVMAELGFEQITQPGMLQSAGRFMTIPKGARLKKLDMNVIKKAFLDRGYSIEE
ncbi:DUF1858 domain-containing protein [Paenibacillus motobuensis]|uniref:DUF1858 domain-containing protein n=1 Tax=Paenibacillus TaxID=44249 RepID=UPI00203AEEAF|nr:MULTISPECIES: DUF1858 domain-containing protein [Paenibacillus]MCM3041408.1 DUF1858 domain-containing protein [Paenibacillus lutimineralis]MCM3648512.1 DUF1858 domain-containing protein [Paenibacillus motobuensis]